MRFFNISTTWNIQVRLDSTATSTWKNDFFYRTNLPKSSVRKTTVHAAFIANLRLLCCTTKNINVLNQKNKTNTFFKSCCAITTFTTIIAETVSRSFYWTRLKFRKKLGNAARSCSNWDRQACKRKPFNSAPTTLMFVQQYAFAKHHVGSMMNLVKTHVGLIMVCRFRFWFAIVCVKKLVAASAPVTFQKSLHSQRLQQFLTFFTHWTISRPPLPALSASWITCAAARQISRRRCGRAGGCENTC